MISNQIKTLFLSGVILLSVSPILARPNFNIDILSFKPISGTEGCWGYVDSATGREYALICAHTRLEIWDISDPHNPVLTKSVPASGTDLKQVRPYSHYAFAVNQSGVGLQVIDLEYPAYAVTINNYQTVSNNGGAHTVHIDGHYAYLGMNGNSPYSWRIINISDPLYLVPEGQYMTSVTGEYVQSHDSHIKGNTAFIAFLGGGFSIVDIRARSLPRKISDVLYPGAFTHNCWTSEDGQYLFTTDEIPGGHLRVWDIRNPASPIQAAEWMPPGIPSMVHNVQVKGNFLYISYYADGIVILDVEDPTQPIEVGHYDIAPEDPSSGQYAGCWDFFPFFPSGTLLASNYSGPAGMALLRFNGAKAGRIKGSVTDSLFGKSLQNVAIRFLGTPGRGQTDSAGEFLVRTDSGTYQLEFSLAGFLPETVTVAGRLNDTVELGSVRLKPTSLLPATPPNFAVRPDNNGNIHLSWLPPPDSNLAGFRLYRALLSDSADFFQLDSLGPQESTFVDSGSTPGEQFFYRLASVNASGYTSFPSPPVKSMRYVFGSKVLLVDRTAYCTPYLNRYSIAADSFYNFHARLLRRYDFDTLVLNDCTVRFAVNPAFVTRYPYIVLHSSEFFTPLSQDNASFLSYFNDYLKAGGRLLVEGHWPPLQVNPVTLCSYNAALLPNANPNIWDSVRSAFGFDCLYYPTTHFLNNNLFYHSFISSQSKNAFYPNLAVDSLRVNHFVPTSVSSPYYPHPTMPNVGYLSNRNPAEDLYTFGSILGQDDPKQGQTVAKKHLDPATGGGFVWFHFPLYFMKEDSAKKAFRQALIDLGVPEKFPKGDFDRNGVRSLEDVVYLLNWVFLGEPFPIIFDASEADLNCDSRSSPADVIFLLKNVFPGQPLPCN